MQVPFLRRLEFILDDYGLVWVPDSDSARLVVRGVHFEASEGRLGGLVRTAASETVVLLHRVGHLIQVCA